MSRSSSKFLPAVQRYLETKGFISIGSRYSVPPRVTTYGTPQLADFWDLERVVTEGFERVVWVYKAVDIIAGNASRLPFQITVGDEDEVEDHPLLRVMNKRANPLETGRHFRKRLSQQVLLSKKGAFVETTHTRGGRLVRLDLLPPDRVRIIPDLSGDYVDYFEFTRYDGEVRPLPPEKVRWIRDAHPLDPFSGNTPLESAGMSVELDRLARAYNVNFINRDGRPGGIVGVDTEGLPAEELDRIARLFKPGAQHAGEVRAIGVGKGGMNYVDTSAKPRDMAYETTSDKARKEILAAFGVPESIAGDASDRTFDNAAQELFGFWHDTMIPHLDLISSAFDGDVAEQMDCGFDTTDVEPLEMPARRRRQEARDEVDKGLRSPKEYRDLRPELDVIDNPQTRALWMSPAKAPVPGRPDDAAALGLEDPAGGGMPGMPGAPGGPAGPPDPNAPVPPGGGGTAAEAVQQALDAGGQVSAAVTDPNSAAGVVAAAQQARDTEAPDGPAAAAVAEARALTDGIEGKMLLGREFRIVPDTTTEAYEPGEDEIKPVELAVNAALTAMLARQAGVIAARLQEPKHRKGTRYWVADGETDTRIGDDPIDSASVMDAPRWAAETQETLLPIVQPAAAESAGGLLEAMAASGALVLATQAGAVVAGRTVEAPKATAEQVAAYAGYSVVPAVMLAVVTAASAMTDWLTDRASQLDKLMIDQPAPDVLPLVEAMKKTWAEEARSFTEGVSLTVAQTVVAGARDTALGGLTPSPQTPPVGEGRLVELDPEVLRVWRTRHDERVRKTHRDVDGQAVKVGEAFTVGGVPVRFPSDPLAPPSQSRHCRCWLKYQWTTGAKFILPVRAA